MQHIIKKQVIEAKLPGSHDMFELQQKISRYFYSHILPALEKVFDKLSDENTIVQIDRLEIDLGEIQWDKISGEISVDHLFTLLENETQRVVSHLPHQYIPFNRLNPSSRKTTVSQNACEQWLYYMQKGIIPWNTNIVDATWRNNVLEALATDYRLVADLKTLIEKDESALKRIVHEHSISFLVTITEVLTAENQQLLPQLAGEISRMFHPTLPFSNYPADKPVRNESVIIWQQLLKKAAEGTTGRSSIQLAKQYVVEAMHKKPLLQETVDVLRNELPLLGPLIIELVKLSHPVQENEQSSLHATPEKIEIELKNHASAPVEESTSQEKKQMIFPLNNEQSKTLGEKGSSNKEDQKPFVSSGGFTIPDEGIYTRYTGLVLLHPFFRLLFNHTGLIQQNRFIGRLEQEKAIYLLHYLVTGTTEAEDYLLAVPKLLCGLSLDQSLRQPALTATDIAEADDLISAAISQWPILKNTSADGLREGFLQRNGKVFLNNGDICFIVERNAIDALLGYLPWNLSIIKLPWLNELIKVEWV
jgi:hypothetical protein